MRIISQNGEYDMPYDDTIFYQDGHSIYICSPKVRLIAQYSTPQKTAKVMKMLHDMYLSRMELDGGYDFVTQCYVQPNYWVLPKVFKFPQDEEVEADNETNT